MKTLLIYFNSMQAAGGIERVIATLSEKLSAYYQVTILVKDDPISFYPLSSGVNIESLYAPLDFNMESKPQRLFSVAKNIINIPFKLKRYLQTHSFDYYYLAHPLHVLEFSLAGAAMNKVIVSEHGARSAYNWPYRFIKQMLYKRTLQYVVPTKSETAYYKEQRFPAVYIPHFKPKLPYGLSPKLGKRVLTIGRLTAEKQQDVLLSIWRNIIYHHGFTDWHLEIVGSGEMEDQLLQKIADYKLENYAFLVPSRLRIEQFYQGASIFVLTSRSEGFGMVLLEAISFGLPCISFDCPAGPRDIIKDGISGYLIPQNDMGSFEETLKKLMGQPDRIQTMGKVAYESSEQWRDENILKKWKEVLSA